MTREQTVKGYDPLAPEYADRFCDELEGKKRVSTSSRRWPNLRPQLSVTEPSLAWRPLACGV